MPLDAFYPQGSPLRAESFAFFGFANGAVALSAVVAIEHVAALAVRFLRVDVAHRARVALRVFRWRQRVEVLRVDAVAIAAGVIHHVPLWDRSPGHPQRHAVRLSVHSAHADDSVAVLVGSSGPQQAVSARMAIRLETLALFGGRLGRCSGEDGTHG